MYFLVDDIGFIVYCWNQKIVIIYQTAFALISFCLLGLVSLELNTPSRAAERGAGWANRPRASTYKGPGNTKFFKVWGPHKQ